jgi:hypothetical protein
MGRDCETREDVAAVQKYMASHPGVDVEEAKTHALGPGRIAPVPDEYAITPRERAAHYLFANLVGLSAEDQWLEVKRRFARALADASHKDHQAALAARSATGGDGGAPLDTPTPGEIRWPPHPMYEAVDKWPAEQHVTHRPEPFTPRVPG